MAGLFDLIPGLGPIMNIIGGVGGILSGNQLGQQGTGNWEAAANSIYQPQYTGQSDTALWNQISAPTEGRSAIAKLLADLQNPAGAQNSAITEGVRSSLADRGLATSPIGAVLENTNLIPALSNAKMGAANALQGMDMQQIQALMQYLNTGVNAGVQRGNLLAGIGGQQVGMGNLMGQQAGQALSPLFNPPGSTIPPTTGGAAYSGVDRSGLRNVSAYRNPYGGY